MDENVSLASSFLAQYGGAYGIDISEEDCEDMAAYAEAEAHAKLQHRSIDKELNEKIEARKRARRLKKGRADQKGSENRSDEGGSQVNV